MLVAAVLIVNYNNITVSGQSPMGWIRLGGGFLWLAGKKGLDRLVELN
jgi:hypothetical protein